MDESSEIFGILKIFSKEKDIEASSICKLFKGDNFLTLSDKKENIIPTFRDDSDALTLITLNEQDDYNIEDLGKETGVLKNGKRLKANKVFELQEGKPMFIDRLRCEFFSCFSEDYVKWAKKNEEKQFLLLGNEKQKFEQKKLEDAQKKIREIEIINGEAKQKFLNIKIAKIDEEIDPPKPLINQINHKININEQKITQSNSRITTIDEEVESWKPKSSPLINHRTIPIPSKILTPNMKLSLTDIKQNIQDMKITTIDEENELPKPKITTTIEIKDDDVEQKKKIPLIEIDIDDGINIAVDDDPIIKGIKEKLRKEIEDKRKKEEDKLKEKEKNRREREIEEKLAREEEDKKVKEFKRLAEEKKRIKAEERKFSEEQEKRFREIERKFREETELSADKERRMKEAQAKRMREEQIKKIKEDHERKIREDQEERLREMKSKRLQEDESKRQRGYDVNRVRQLEAEEKRTRYLNGVAEKEEKQALKELEEKKQQEEEELKKRKHLDEKQKTDENDKRYKESDIKHFKKEQEKLIKEMEEKRLKQLDEYERERKKENSSLFLEIDKDGDEDNYREEINLRKKEISEKETKEEEEKKARLKILEEYEIEKRKERAALLRELGKGGGEDNNTILTEEEYCRKEIIEMEADEARKKEWRLKQLEDYEREKKKEKAALLKELVECGGEDNNAILTEEEYQRKNDATEKEIREADEKRKKEWMREQTRIREDEENFRKEENLRKQDEERKKNEKQKKIEEEIVQKTPDERKVLDEKKSLLSFLKGNNNKFSDIGIRPKVNENKINEIKINDTIIIQDIRKNVNKINDNITDKKINDITKTSEINKTSDNKTDEINNEDLKLRSDMNEDSKIDDIKTNPVENNKIFEETIKKIEMMEIEEEDKKVFMSETTNLNLGIENPENIQQSAQIKNDQTFILKSETNQSIPIMPPQPPKPTKSYECMFKKSSFQKVVVRPLPLMKVNKEKNLQAPPSDINKPIMIDDVVEKKELPMIEARVLKENKTQKKEKKGKEKPKKGETKRAAKKDKKPKEVHEEADPQPKLTDEFLFDEAKINLNNNIFLEDEDEEIAKNDNFEECTNLKQTTLTETNTLKKNEDKVCEKLNENILNKDNKEILNNIYFNVNNITEINSNNLQNSKELPDQIIEILDNNKKTLDKKDISSILPDPEKDLSSITNPTKKDNFFLIPPTEKNVPISSLTKIKWEDMDISELLDHAIFKKEEKLIKTNSPSPKNEKNMKYDDIENDDGKSSINASNSPSKKKIQPIIENEIKLSDKKIQNSTLQKKKNNEDLDFSDEDLASESKKEIKPVQQNLNNRLNEKEMKILFGQRKDRDIQENNSANSSKTKKQENMEIELDSEKTKTNIENISNQEAATKRKREDYDEDDAIHDKLTKKLLLEIKDRNGGIKTQNILQNESNGKTRSKKSISQTSSIPKFSTRSKPTEVIIIDESSNYKRNFRVLSSGFVESEANQKILKGFGIYCLDDMFKDFDILIMPNYKRTIKFLLALTKGIPIVSRSWSDDCVKQNKILSYKNYFIKDEASEKQYSYNLKKSLDKRLKNKQGFLFGYKIWIPKDIKPCYKDIKLLIKESDGEILEEIYKGKNDFCINIMNEKNPDSIKLINQGLMIHTIELLYTGILRQEVDLKSFVII